MYNTVEDIYVLKLYLPFLISSFFITAMKKVNIIHLSIEHILMVLQVVKQVLPSKKQKKSTFISPPDHSGQHTQCCDIRTWEFPHLSPVAANSGMGLSDIGYNAIPRESH